ncbi:MAG: 3'-5' exonuclease [Myxococcales bacterium FL481]|nr:MAG: 3'-5' exonuclease [Myxococcales bacterium FL481]
MSTRETHATPTPAIAELGPRFFSFVEGLRRPVVFFDLETTGIDPMRDRIIELCLLRVCPLPVAIEAPRSWRVNPEMKIPSESTKIHRLTDDDVRDAPKFADIADDILALIRDADLAGFSVSRFDVRVLLNEFARCGKGLSASEVRVVDSQVIFHRREPRDLSAAMRYYADKPLPDAHTAEADTIASLEVFAGQLRRYEDLPIDVDQLHDISATINAGFVDSARRFVWRDEEPVFNFGKLKDKPLRWAAADPNEREYLRWILQQPFEDDTKAVVREALEGKIRRSPHG